MSGTLSSADGISKVFSKPAKAATGVAGAAGSVAQVPVERVVGSPRKTVGRGRRDTILNGADGV